MPFPDINLSSFTYQLPADRIAEFLLERRDSSKLLFYDKGKIEDKVFTDLPGLLPKKSLVVFNNTRVIPARIHFERESGAHIEILLDKAFSPSADPIICLSKSESVAWKCIVGNKKKWKDGEVLKGFFGKELEIRAQWKNRQENIVEFRWDSDLSFAKILEYIGHVPLPPYIHRADEKSDIENYQTVYAKFQGAVAAPTAGLHFTEDVLADLKTNDIKIDELTLHVGAGTFQPIKSDDISEHDMHSELMHINRENILHLLYHNGPIVPVGTTAMRSLESLYWFGLRLGHENCEKFEIDKEIAYRGKGDIPLKEALQNILNWMDAKEIMDFSGETAIFIIPGYQFKVCSGIITNFHQPGTTLILLIAALIGADWKKVYDHALTNSYRFLSYGDSSLLIP